MQSFIHGIINNSEKWLGLILLDEYGRVSYDVVVGAGTSIEYDKLLPRRSMPVPIALNEFDFARSRVQMRLNGDAFGLFCTENGSLQIAPDDVYANRKPIEGFAGPGPIEITIETDGNFRARAAQFLTGPQMTAVSWATSRYGLYGINESNGSLVGKTFIDSWKPWETVGSPTVGLAGRVAAASWVAGRYSVYALDPTGTMWERAWLTTRWEEWMQHRDPGTTRMRSISAVTWIAGRFGIYGIGDDGNLWQKWWATDNWNDWQNLGRPKDVTLTGEITAVCWDVSQYAIYAVGSDGELWQKWWSASSWTDWDKRARPPANLRSLSSCSWGSLTYTICGVNPDDGNLWDLRYRHGWEPWTNRGKPFGIALSGACAAINWIAGQYAYYAIGVDGQLYELYNDAWNRVDGN